MTSRGWIATGTIVGALTVLLGAFGAHGLEARLDADQLETWNTAVLYQGLHAPALVLFGLWQRLARRGGLPGGLLLLGVILFSGSLYLWCLGGPGWLVWCTPVGGVALIAGWVAWTIQVLGSPDPGTETLAR